MNASQSSDLVSPELRQLLHRVDALTPITPPPPSAVPVAVMPRSTPPTRSTLVTAMVAVITAIAGIGVLAGVLTDGSPSLPPGPLSSLPEPTLPLVSPTGEFAGEQSCRDELAVQSSNNPQWSTDIVDVVVFEVIDTPSMVRVVLVSNDRAFLCTTERSFDSAEPIDSMSTVFDPSAVPTATGIVVHASQFETTADVPVTGPGRVWITGRFGADVDQITYISADGERTTASTQRDWFSLAAPIGDGVALDDGSIEVRTVDGTTRTTPTATLAMNDVID